MLNTNNKKIKLNPAEMFSTVIFPDESLQQWQLDILIEIFPQIVPGNSYGQRLTSVKRV
jgi:hypothetical protein